MLTFASAKRSGHISLFAPHLESSLCNSEDLLCKIQNINNHFKVIDGLKSKLNSELLQVTDDITALKEKITSEQYYYNSSVYIKEELGVLVQ